MGKIELKDVIDNNNGEEEDVLNLKNNLRDLGYYEMPHYGMTGYTDEETFKGLKKFQEDNHLTVDGVIKPGGETETALNERLKARENRASSVNENDSRLEELRNSYQDKLQRKNLLDDSPNQSQPSARQKTEEDTWGKLPETANQKPIFDQQKPVEKSSTPPNHSLQPDNLLTSEADKEAEKIDDRMQQLHDQYRNTLVRRNLLTPSTASSLSQPAKREQLIEQTIQVDPLEDLIERNQELIINHEGCLSYPYIDTTGNISVGCGINIDSWENSKRQQWEGNPNENAIRKEYDKLVDEKHNLPHKKDGQGRKIYNVSAAHFKDKSNLRIKDMQTSYKAKAREIMEPHLQYLKTQGIDFFKLPQEVQNAHYDMVYNIGPSKFKEYTLNKDGIETPAWKNYYKALKTNKYDIMAKESHRRDPSPERNKYVYDLLMKAHNNRK